MKKRKPYLFVLLFAFWIEFVVSLYRKPNPLHCCDNINILQIFLKHVWQQLIFSYVYCILDPVSINITIDNNLLLNLNQYNTKNRHIILLFLF